MEKNILGKSIMNKISKKHIILFAIFICLSIIIILMCKTSSNNNNTEYVRDNKDAISIGEMRYLEFLWMVDGAFNYERYDNKDFTINGKKLEKKPDFRCIYDKNMKTCQATNFENSFNKVFASNIDMNKVYGDGAVIKWYEKNDNGYTFSNINNCDAMRMNLNQQLKVVETTKTKNTYQVTYDEELTSGPYKGKYHYEKEFVLVKENGDWKVSKAYFHDPCYMEYNIT